jgi:hypothetical protein
MRRTQPFERGRLVQRSDVPEHGHQRLLHRVVGGFECDRAADPADVRTQLAQQPLHGDGVAALGASNELLHNSKRKGTDERFRASLG